MNSSLRIIKSEEQENSFKKDYINRFAENEPKKGVFMSDFIASTISRKAKRMSSTYTKGYETLIHHLENFSRINDVNIYTNSINEVFLDDFIVYLEELDLKINYIKNLIILLKGMTKKAGAYGYVVDFTYDDVTLKDEDVFSVYLSASEITRIYYFKGLTRKQERIKDIFIVGCLTALRYSDYSTLTKENFTSDGNYLVKITKKTGKKVIIPVHDFIKEILNKYDGEIFSGLSIQHFNRYIKTICKKVGITDKITFSYTRGGHLHTKTCEKWEMISSHTARRSAATNMYLTGRLKTFEIMSLTGHTTEKSFFKYIKVTKEDISKQIAGDTFFRK